MCTILSFILGLIGTTILIIALRVLKNDKNDWERNRLKTKQGKPLTDEEVFDILKP